LLLFRELNGEFYSYERKYKLDDNWTKEEERLYSYERKLGDMFLCIFARVKDYIVMKESMNVLLGDSWTKEEERKRRKKV